MRVWMLMAVLALTACHGTGRGGDPLAGAEKMRVTLVSTGPRTIQVQMETRGAFVNQESLPLDPAAKAVIGGKPVAVSQVRPGATVTIWRDAKTRRVIRIEGD